MSIVRNNILILQLSYNIDMTLSTNIYDFFFK
jgi:hypothetical protein